MSMLDGFFNKGFKGAKCKTLLKLTIPRIKLLRNRREIQIKQMRKDIAKLLETGQEATARIRVEHIIREVNMMAAQEIIELFCELIAVRIPIIETQRYWANETGMMSYERAGTLGLGKKSFQECPLDLKEAISSVCFAAPRCADLPELQQVQMLFTSKYGKEFVSAATELMPDCGVNRQLIELLSIRAPPAEVKLKLLKEIAEEHELDWDPAASETEFFKSHEDLLNGPSEFVSGSKLALPEEKHEALCSAPVETAYADSKSDSGLDSFDLPEVPKFSVRQNPVSVSAPVFVPPTPPSPSGIEDEPTKLSGRSEDIPHQSYLELDAVMPEQLVASSPTLGDTSVSKREEKQFLPFISPPPLSSTSFPTRQSEPASSFSRTKSDFNVDLQDVLAAAQAAAESAERAAAAARSAASLAQVRITELVNMQNDCATENKECLFHSQSPNEFTTLRTQQFDHQQSFGNTDHSSYSDPPNHGSDCVSEAVNSPSFDMTKVECASPHTDDHNPKLEFTHHQPQRSTSVEDDPYFSYPNLFTAQDSTVGSGNHSSEDASRSTHEH